MRVLPLRLFCVAIAAVGLAACTDSSGGGTSSGDRLDACRTAPTTCNAGTAKKGGEITWMVEQGWGNQWNPMRPEGGSYYLAEMLAGIAPLTGDFSPTGVWQWNTDLLTSTPKLTNTNPQTVQFTLRKQAVWSDGVPISVDDFRYNWFHNSGRADQCVGCDPADTTGWAQVASITSAGQTITVTYQAGAHDPEWFAHLGPSIDPAHIATQAGINWQTPAGMGKASAYFRDTVPKWSGGPYEIQSVVPDQRVVMVPNPKWYGAHAPTLSKIVKEVLTEPSDWQAALENGEIDGGAPLAYDPDVARQLNSTSGISTAIANAGATWEHVDLNVRTPALKDIALRKAILTATDTADLEHRLYGSTHLTPRTNPLFPVDSPYHTDVLSGTGFGTGNLTAARKLLTDAGYTGANSGQHLAKNGKAVPALRFVYLAGNPTRGTVVELEMAQLSELGISIKPVAVPGSDILTNYSHGAFDMTVFAFDGGPLFTETPGQYYGSKSSVNFPGIVDPSIDKAAAAILTETDIKAAAAHANEVAKLVMADAFTLPLWENPSYLFVRSSYVNIRDNPMTNDRATYNIGSWGVAAH